MTAFFSTQLDFIYFFYGLAFFLLGSTCIAIARRPGRPEAWTVLALFAFCHGAGEWLDLTALVIGDTRVFAAGRLAVMTTSFVLLMEFARREAIRLGWRLPGPWLYIPLLSIIAIAGVVGDTNTAGATARYVVGFVASLATACVFARLATEFTGFTRRLAMCSAAGFAVYALAAGLVVPPAPFWPAALFNSEWFDRTVGIPIQLVRGLLACWLAFSMWAIWGQHVVSEVASARYAQFHRRQFGWTLATMVVILVTGWTLTEFLGGIYKQNLQLESRSDIDLLSSRLTGETAMIEGMVKALAGSPSVLPLVTGGGRDELARAKSVLDLDVAASGADLGYILDPSGTVAASSGRSAASDDAKLNYHSAAFFRKAVAGEAGYHFAFDLRNGLPEYQASYPIRGDDGAIVGVAVLKKSLGAFAADLAELDHPYFLIDPDGVVALTNLPNMRLHTLWPLSEQTRSRLADEFGSLGERPLVDNEIVDATWINVNGSRDYARRRYANHSRWSLVILEPSREIYASRVLGIIVTLLTAMMALIYLFGRERLVHDKVQMQRRVKLQELARDLRFQASTDPLTGLYNRLKFDEELASEVLRATRYETPLSLVLFDIDRFKKINDTHGHQAGDKVLIQLSRIVAANVRGTDIVARWGGEEFVIMLPNADGRTACQVAEKLRAAIGEAAFESFGTVTCSFGVAEYLNGATAETLVAMADDALYRAKMNGRNRVELAAPPDAAESGLISVA